MGCVGKVLEWKRSLEVQSEVNTERGVVTKHYTKRMENVALSLSGHTDEEKDPLTPVLFTPLPDPLTPVLFTPLPDPLTPPDLQHKV
ncbi:hypothetical protein Pmani_018604 [Petrolisthes manimaculis]|uniref:Uncharacterized protein n=1 Tax=Petrolisthes manimaculis TaxID=1843537 RepID=A0AAE1PKP8_9EUCA|nr:hypothetical protein Pmani_018604 [Petrolisthes manimaculis]